MASSAQCSLAAPVRLGRCFSATRWFRADVILALVLMGASACKTRDAGPTGGPESRGTDQAIVAVGRRMLTANELSLLCHDAGVPPDLFAERWATDSVIAEAARGGALHASRVHQVERSVLARALMASLFESARSQGEPTERELETVRSEHWAEVNRPEASQTTHFVVMQRARQNTARAEALARALADAVRVARSSEQFKDIVDKYPTDGLEVIAESLPPVTADGRSLRLEADGRVIGEGPPFNAVFARAANLLQAPGQQSGLVHTEFGYHVILLERKIPPFKAGDESLKERFASEIHSRRAREAVEKSIQDSRRTNPVHVENSFQEAIAQVQVVQ